MNVTQVATDETCFTQADGAARSVALCTLCHHLADSTSSGKPLAALQSELMETLNTLLEEGRDDILMHALATLYETNHDLAVQLDETLEAQTETLYLRAKDVSYVLRLSLIPVISTATDREQNRIGLFTDTDLAQLESAFKATGIVGSKVKLCIANRLYAREELDGLSYSQLRKFAKNVGLILVNLESPRRQLGAIDLGVLRPKTARKTSHASVEANYFLMASLVETQHENSPEGQDLASFLTDELTDNEGQQLTALSNAMDALIPSCLMSKGLMTAADPLYRLVLPGSYHEARHDTLMEQTNTFAALEMKYCLERHGLFMQEAYAVMIAVPGSLAPLQELRISLFDRSTDQFIAGVARPLTVFEDLDYVVDTLSDAMAALGLVDIGWVENSMPDAQCHDCGGELYPLASRTEARILDRPSARDAVTLCHRARRATRLC